MRTIGGPAGFVALALGFASACGFGASARGECLDYGAYVHQVGHLDMDVPGPGFVTTSSDYAYVTDDSGLVVVDVSNSKAPEIVGSLHRAAGAQTTVVQGGYAYFTDAFGLSVADVSDPRHPRNVGHANTRGRAIAVVVRDTLAYVAEIDGLDVLDCSNSTNPRIAASMDLPELDDISVLGSTVYALSWDAIYSIDISDPMSPRVIGALAMAMPEKVVACHNYLYVADEVAGLEILDVSKPSSPQIVGTLAIGGAGWVAVSDTIACVSAGGKTALVDVANPKTPQIIGYAESGGSTAVYGSKWTRATSSQ